MLFLALACTDAPLDSVAPDPLDWDASEAGPYNVGYQTWDITYRPTGEGEDRTLNLSMWYPTDDTSGPTGTYYEFIDAPNVLADATMADSVYAAGAPVHAHSHGYSGYAESSAFLMERFASHGWVVIAPDHTGNTLAEHTDDLPHTFDWLRGEDMTAAIDAAEAFGNTDAVFLSGHSYGGGTTWVTAGATFDPDLAAAKCSEPDDCTENDLARFEAGVHDPRVAAGYPMDGNGGGYVTADGYAAVQVPMLMITAVEEGEPSTDTWDQQTGDVTWVSLQGGCHQTFALGGCSGLDTDEGYDIVSDFGLAFARSTMLGDATQDGVLDGSTSISDVATVYTR